MKRPHQVTDTNLPADSMLRFLPDMLALSPERINVPRTEVVRLSANEAMSFLGDHGNGAGHTVDDVVARVELAAKKIGYPVFIRTDHASHKHAGPKAYRADSFLDVRRVVCDLIDWNIAHDLLPHGILVREFLTLQAGFTAFAGLPIAVERRVFADADHGLLCIHPYWPKAAIKFYDRRTKDEPEGWEDVLRAQDTVVFPPPTAFLAYKLARTWHGTYSVDFARDLAGRWWLIDAATARHSTHPDPECRIPSRYPSLFLDDRRVPPADDVDRGPLIVGGVRV